MKFSAVTDGAQRTNLTDFGNLLSISVAPPAGHTFYSSNI